MDDISNALSSTSLFAGLSKPHLGLIERVTDRVVVTDGYELFRQGEPATHMAIVVEGTLDVIVDGAKIASIGPGEVVGELSLVDGEPASATVRAVGEATIYNIARVGFVPVWRKNPEIGDAMLLAVVQRLRATNKNL